MFAHSIAEKSEQMNIVADLFCNQPAGFDFLLQ